MSARLKKSTVIVFPREMSQSLAFLALKNISVKVLFVFYGKRQVAPGGKTSRDPWVCTNNGQIEFTYLEAEKKYDFSKKQFSAALKDLQPAGVHRRIAHWRSLPAGQE